MKNLVTVLAGAALVAGCAQTPESKPAAAASPAPIARASSACVPAPSELEVKELDAGKGEERVRFRTAVLVNYTGWVYDGCKADRKGEMFDTSAGRATPFGFMVGAGRVIKGWDEGLIGMKEGGKRLLVIPPDKAYGSSPPTPKIPPNSTLVFEVELLKVLQQAQ